MVDEKHQWGDAPTDRTVSRRRVLGTLSMGMAALAGCSGGQGGSATTTSEETTTATTQSPTTTTETEPTLESVSFPDGVTEDSVTANLLLAHKLAVSGTAYTITTQHSGPYRTTRTTIKLGTSKAAQKQVGVSGATKSFWKNGSVGYCRANGGAYYYHCDPTVNRERIASYDLLSRHIRLGDYAPARVTERNGTTLITATASSATVTERLSHRIESVKSYTGTLTFTPEGVIRSLSYTMTVVRPWDQQAETIEFSWKASKIGNTTVSPPAWLSTAKERAFDFEVSAHPEKNYVTVDVVAGAGTFPVGYVTLTGPGGEYDADQRVPLENGDTLYVAPLSSGKLGVAVGEPPSGRASVSGSWRLNVHGNGQLVIEERVSL